jgi:hypothetical protein
VFVRTDVRRPLNLKEAAMAGAIDNIGYELAADAAVATSETLTRETIQWLAELPAEVMPQHLPLRFPRMANALHCRWADRKACLAYLDDLIIDKRGTRRGFPDEILEELATLKNYFQTAVYPVPQTVWDEIAERRAGK